MVSVTVPLDGLILESVLFVLLATQMLVPSNATPTGPEFGGRLTLATMFVFDGSILVTVLALKFATQMLLPS